MDGGAVVSLISQELANTPEFRALPGLKWSAYEGYQIQNASKQRMMPSGIVAVECTIAGETLEWHFIVLP